MTQIACLHGHHSNIGLMDETFATWAVEIAHYVDPGLLLQNKGKCPPTQEQVQDRLRSQLDWMKASMPDAILITCTQYAACLSAEMEAAFPLPILTIDGPFFDEVSKRPGPQVLLFSNPATVTPTMNRLGEHAAACNFQPQVEIHVAEGAFDLIMTNQQQAYHDAIWSSLQSLHDSHPSSFLSVAQLSMVPIARDFACKKGIPVSHPLQSLTERMVQTLHLVEK